ncbi:hypothetical protein ACIRPS_01170 [Streptomyces griseoviridis]
MAVQLEGAAQTACALALRFAGLPKERQRRGAVRCLGRIMRAAGHRIAIGFMGTPLIR